VNKAELIDALATRLGDKRTAGTALDAVLAEVQTAVAKGEKVSITGFGVFEKRTRAARMARNPRTGAAVRVKKTAVPAFRPGTGFREMVASGRVPKTLKAAPAKKTTKATTARKTSAAKATRKTASKKAPAKRASTRRATKR
jgi:DNA-binding protein HU-beta